MCSLRFRRRPAPGDRGNLEPDDQRALEPGRPDLGRGRARADHAAERRRPGLRAGGRRRPRRHERVRGALRRPLPRPCRGPGARRERALGEAAEEPRRADHDHEPASGGPVLLRSADPAVDVLRRRIRRAVQPAGRHTSSSTSRPRAAGSSRTTRRTRRTTSPRRRPTRDRRCRTSSVKRLAASTATSTGSRCCTTRRSRSSRGRRSRVQPQARHHARRELQHRVRAGRPRPTCSTTTALSRGFAVMSHALNNSGHNCNVVVQAEAMMMAKERVIEQYGELRYTIGIRLLRRCARPVPGRERLPRHLPGDHAGLLASPIRGRAGCSTRTTRCSAATSRTRRPGSRVSPGRRSTCRRVMGHPNYVNSIVYNTAIAALLDPSRDCPGVAAARRLRPGEQSGRRPLLAPGLHGQRLRPPLAATASPAGPGTRPESNTAGRR